MNFTLINNTDGPTSVFFAGKLGLNWINFFGLIIMMLIMIPNIIYAVKRKGNLTTYKNKFIDCLEQIGRYASMFLMVFNIGLFEFGFCSTEMFITYAIGNSILIVLYLIFWIPYSKHNTLWNGMILAIIPACIFILSGVTLRHYLLVISSIIFAIGHVTMTYKTHEKSV